LEKTLRTDSRNNELVTVAQLAEFDEIIDTRSESEFAEDHIPGAVNYPVLNDNERVRVGTLYKQVSAFDARKRGAAQLRPQAACRKVDNIRRLFASTHRETQQTDIILTLTPHIIRVLDLTEADLRPFRVGRDSVSPLAELPLPVEPPKPPEPPKEEPPPVKKPGGGR
jgi:rhodanese-related sulfurtransferase